jgi:uncharacterized repeat protein (TIGR02543 family)
MALHDTASFTVQPKANLGSGDYGEEIIIACGPGGASVTVPVNFKVNGDPTIRVSASPASVRFGNLKYPYTQPARQTVTLTNNGSSAVTLSQPTSMNFVIGTLSSATIPKKGTATFTIQPISGLDIGSYDELIDIYTTMGEKAATVSVTFSVTDGSVFSITFDALGGLVSPTSAVTGSDGRLGGLPTPSRDGYSFMGWFRSITGGAVVTESTVFTADAVIYARWSAETAGPYAVTFSAGANGSLSASVDGSEISSGSMVQRGKDVVFTAVPIEGYSVVRWTINGVVVADTSRAYVLAGISRETVVSVSFDKLNDIKDPDREIPKSGSKGEVSIVAPSSLAAELAVGPNPVSKSQGSISLYRSGSRITEATLTILDATGSTVKKIKITDDASSGQLKRKVGSWNLKDAKGRVVPVGTYVIKGVIKTTSGKTERVSVVVGVK